MVEKVEINEWIMIFCEVVKILVNRVGKELLIVLDIVWDKILYNDCFLIVVEVVNEWVDVVELGEEVFRKLEIGEVIKGNRLFVVKLLLVWWGIIWIIKR